MLVLLTIVVTTLFWRAAPVRPAYAQLPDAGAQRAAILQELRASNSKLTEITSLLKQIRDQTKPKSEKPEPHKSRP
ncbi:MAG: hypothetical protein D6744_03080 [Planctomycetota bacterium]|nr:MAG: hypothetical protein D6744_03080 [Planctomycetota bacterium]